MEYYNDKSYLLGYFRKRHHTKREKLVFHERMGNAMDDYVIDFDSLNYLRPETLAIMKLLVKKYNESKDDDVLQDGVVVSFDELAKAAKIPVDKLPDEVFKDLDAERNQFDEEKRGYEPLVASCLADEEDREFRIIINHRLFEF